MPATPLTSSHRGFAPLLLTVAAAIGLLILISTIPEDSDLYKSGASAAIPCESVADVIAAQDRSRSGISVNCNVDKLNQTAN